MTTTESTDTEMGYAVKFQTARTPPSQIFGPVSCGAPPQDVCWRMSCANCTYGQSGTANREVLLRS